MLTTTGRVSDFPCMHLERFAPSSGGNAEPDQSAPHDDSMPMKINSKPPVLAAIGVVLTVCLAASMLKPSLLLVCLVIAPGLFAYLLLSGKPFFILAPPVLAIAAALLIGKDPTMLLFLGFPLAASAGMTYCLFRKKNKTQTVVWTMLGTLAWAAVFFAAVVLARAGALTAQSMGDTVQALLASFKNALSPSFQALGDASAIDPAALESAKQELMRQLQLLLPAYLILTLELTGYLSAQVFGLIARVTKSQSILEARVWRLTVSPMAAGLYLLLAVAMLISSITGSDSAVAIACTNLYQIFLYPLFLIGARNFYHLVNRSFLFILFLIFLSFTSFFLLAVHLLAVYAVAGILYDRYKENEDNRYSK